MSKLIFALLCTTLALPSFAADQPIIPDLMARYIVDTKQNLPVTLKNGAKIINVATNNITIKLSSANTESQTLANLCEDLWLSELSQTGDINITLISETKSETVRLPICMMPAMPNLTKKEMERFVEETNDRAHLINKTRDIMDLALLGVNFDYPSTTLTFRWSMDSAALNSRYVQNKTLSLPAICKEVEDFQQALMKMGYQVRYEIFTNQTTPAYTQNFTRSTCQ